MASQGVMILILARAGSLVKCCSDEEAIPIALKSLIANPLITQLDSSGRWMLPSIISSTAARTHILPTRQLKDLRLPQPYLSHVLIHGQFSWRVRIYTQTHH